MLTPDQISTLGEAARKITAPVSEYLLQDITRRVAEAGQLTSTAQYQVWRAQQLGVSQRELKKELRRRLGLSHQEIRRVLYQSAQSGYDLDIRRFPYVQALPFARNASLQQIVAAAVELAQADFTNLVQTLGMVDPFGRALPLQEAYRSCTDFAFQQVITGAASYTQAIRQATRNLAEKDVRTIDYQSGVHTSLEAAVRRNILGGLGLMLEQVSQVTHDQLGCNGWEISAHANSAPDHEPIQGRQYPDREYEALNNSLRRRIGTLNCGHTAFPIILGVNWPQHSKAELEQFRADNEKGVDIDGQHYTGYEATQMQRKLERTIRAQKRRVMVDEAAGDKEKLSQDQSKLTLLHQRYVQFSKAAGLKTQYERTEVAGVGGNLRTFVQSAGRTDSGPPGKPIQIGTVDFSDERAVLKPLAAAQRAAAGLDHEINCTVTSDGKVWAVEGISGFVDPSGIPSDLTGSYSYHNHPKEQTWFSFSAEDVRFFFQSGEAYSKASDHLYEYVMQRTSETIAVDPNLVYHRFREIYRTEILALSDAGKIDIDKDGFHATMRRLSREYRFVYRRVAVNGSK